MTKTKTKTMKKTTAEAEMLYELLDRVHCMSETFEMLVRKHPACKGGLKKVAEIVGLSLGKLYQAAGEAMWKAGE